MTDDFDKIFSFGNNSNEKKSVNADKNSAGKPAETVRSNKKHNPHPAAALSGIREENVNVEGGYFGEGCREHYFTRFVMEEENFEENEEDLTPLQKAMVFGEILNNPKFKE